MQKVSIFFLKSLVILFFMSFVSCGDKSEIQSDSVQDSTKNDYPKIGLLKRDLIFFTEHFKKTKYKYSQIQWKKTKGPFELSLSNSEYQLALTLLDLGDLPESVLISNFKSIYYYLDQVRINKKYNNIPIPNGTLKFIAKFLTGQFNLNKDQNVGSEQGLRTYSSILKLIEEIDSIRDFPPELIQHYDKMPLEKVKAIITKGSYDAVLEKFSKLQQLNPDSKAYPVFKCAQYWSIAPIMNLDTRYKKDLDRLKRISESVNTLFTNPERYLVGNLSDHLRCVEAVEEALGRQPDILTGQGLFDKYFNFIIKNLWDYPFHGTQCGPFRGVMGSFQNQNTKPKNYCDGNFKSIVDNMYLAYLLKRYEVVENFSSQGKSLLKKGASMRRIVKAETKLEGMLKKTLASPSPSPTPSVQVNKSHPLTKKKKTSKR